MFMRLTIRTEEVSFLTMEVTASVMAVFKQKHSKIPGFFDPLVFNEECLASKAFTMTVRPDSSLQLYSIRLMSRLLVSALSG